MRRQLAVLLTPFLLVLTSTPSTAVTTPADGEFEMTTAPGILPTWTSADIAIVGITPGTVTTSRFANDATVSLPVIARAQTANATAGGFRITNTETGGSVRCLIPTVDTRARVIDCLTGAGYNSALFTIEDIDSRERFTGVDTRTTIYSGMEIRLTRAGAQTLNKELSTTVFSTSVRVATGELSVSRALNPTGLR